MRTLDGLVKPPACWSGVAMQRPPRWRMHLLGLLCVRATQREAKGENESHGCFCTRVCAREIAADRCAVSPSAAGPGVLPHQAAGALEPQAGQPHHQLCGQGATLQGGTRCHTARWDKVPHCKVGEAHCKVGGAHCKVGEAHCEVGEARGAALHRTSSALQHWTRAAALHCGKAPLTSEHANAQRGGPGAEGGLLCWPGTPAAALHQPSALDQYENRATESVRNCRGNKSASWMTHSNVHACMHACTHAHAHKHVHIHTHMHSLTHTHSPTHTFTHTHTCTALRVCQTQLSDLGTIKPRAIADLDETGVARILPWTAPELLFAPASATDKVRGLLPPLPLPPSFPPLPCTQQEF